MKQFLSAALLLLLGPSVWAITVGPGGAVNYEQIRSGAMPFPAAICPDVNRRYEEMTEKLNALKTSIRKDAKCADDQIKVDGFSDLVEEKRVQFWNLINKGRTESLSAEESQKLTTYIESLTKAGGTITDLIAGSSCFKDDKKNNISMDLIASLISESTAAISTVAGPYGPAIGMGGKMTASLISSIDKVVRSRKAYDFTDADQRKTFLKTMCSYNGFRREIDEISRVDEAIEDMTRYQNAIQAQIRGINKACEECKILATEYNSALMQGKEYVRKPISELLVKFKDQVEKANAAFVQQIGTLTVVTVRSWVWA